MIRNTKPVLITFAVIVVFIIGLVTTLSYWFPEYYLPSIFSHFRLQYVILLSISLPFIIWARKKYILLLAVGILIWNLPPILDLYRPPSSALTKTKSDEISSSFSLLTMNVLRINRQFDKVLNEIDKYDPDIVLVSEIDKKWLAGLESLKVEYPFFHLVSKEDNFGIGLFSKIPLLDTEMYFWGKLESPAVLGRAIIEQDTIDILGMHPRAPESPFHFRERNDSFEEVIKLRSSLSEHLVIAGDLNTTSFSYYFKNFLEKTQLSDSRKGLGLYCSWPAYLFPLYITLDHVLLSKELTIRKREVGSFVGSDHYPVYVEIEIP